VVGANRAASAAATASASSIAAAFPKERHVQSMTSAVKA
jgi:hypothetical protein